MSMVKFNELRVTEDGNYLIVDAEVRELPYYENINIKEIVVKNQDQYKDNPSYTGDNCYKEGKVIPGKTFRVEIPISSYTGDMKNDLMFVYVRCEGTLTGQPPCRMDEMATLGVTFYVCPLYNSFMRHIREINSNCEVPKGFINDFLRFKAFKAALEAEHYPEAIRYYNKFIKGGKRFPEVTSKCSCYG